MKKLIRKLTVSAVVLLLTMASCNKEDEVMLSPKESMLVAHTWKLDKLSTSSTTDTLLMSLIPVINTLLDAEAHTRTFFKDKSCVATPGDNGKWALLFAETALNIDESGSKINYDIVSLDDKVLVVVFRDPATKSEVFYHYSAQ